MDFETWWNERNLEAACPPKGIARLAYLRGLRRAAEIVRTEQYLDPEGNAEAIEREASKLEREGV